MATAAEIRRDLSGAISEVNGTHGGYPAQAAVALAHTMRYTAEIAAQLAELNAQGNSIKAPVEAVALPGPDGMAVYYVPSKVCTICARDARTAVINDDWRNEAMIFAPVERVLELLGIKVAVHG